MESKAEKAVQMHREGFNCAQAVFATYAEEYGLTKEQALKVSASLGGGIGMMRETCGAFTGLALLIGMESGSTEGADIEKKRRNYAIVQEAARRFREKFGSLKCAELKGLQPCVAITKPVACDELIRVAAEIWEEMRDEIKQG